MSLEVVTGKRSFNWWRKAVIVVEGCAGKITVGGRPKPPNVDTRTFICLFDSILDCCVVSSVFGESLDVAIGSDCEEV